MFIFIYIYYAPCSCPPAAMVHTKPAQVRRSRSEMARGPEEEKVVSAWEARSQSTKPSMGSVVWWCCVGRL
jgi:hypothetical protein